jgi:hypothetical protein
VIYYCERERRQDMGRKKIFGIAALLSALLIFPLALGANVINVAELPFLGGPLTSSSTKVFVDPDHVINESLQAGSTFTVQVNVSDVTDLFTWQVCMSWNSCILNISRIIPSEFLARSVDQTSSEALGDIVINSTDNGQGFSSFAESILGDVSGISGNGTLVSIEFLVLEYGWTDLNMIVSGSFPATLLNSVGSNVTFTTVDGFFNNKITGDIDGDHDVDPTDFWLFAGKYPSDPALDPLVDLDHDGDIDPTDFWLFAGKYPTV